MAFGNLKFDTLTTSDAKNTSTEKSLDTSYVFNGSAKVWINVVANGSSITDSFNVSSHDDDGTGDGGINFSNNMANQGYSPTTGVRSDIGSFLSQLGIQGINTTSCEYTNVVQSDNNDSAGGTADDDQRNITIHGDVA
tara:strand:+ start:337 stop:750 length:414 start_codon:yes stop_codon:yes gene_type:complete